MDALVSFLDWQLEPSFGLTMIVIGSAVLIGTEVYLGWRELTKEPRE